MVKHWIKVILKERTPNFSLMVMFIKEIMAYKSMIYSDKLILWSLTETFKHAEFLRNEKENEMLWL